MLTDLIFITIFLLHFLLNYFLFQRRLLHPSVLYAFIWMSVIVLHLVCKFTVLPGLFDLSVKAYFIFLSGAVCFTAGALFYKLIHIKTGKKPAVVPAAPQLTYFHPSLVLRIVFLGVAVVGLPFFCRLPLPPLLSQKQRIFW